MTILLKSLLFYYQKRNSMEPKITTSVIGKDKYITKINSSNGNDIIADEPEAKGGQNKGLAPGELLASSLGACTCITMRMYADRKEWPVDNITVKVTYIRDHEENISKFTKEVSLSGDLTEEQQKRMIQIGNKCPIHFTLSNPITIETIVK